MREDCGVRTEGTQVHVAGLRAGWLHLLPKSRSEQRKIQPDNTQGKEGHQLRPGLRPTTLDPSSLSLLPHVYNAARGNNSSRAGGGQQAQEGQAHRRFNALCVSVCVRVRVRERKGDRPKKV